MWHRFHTATRWELSLPFFESLMMKIAVRERVPLLNQSIFSVLCLVDRSFGWEVATYWYLHWYPILSDVISFFDLSHHTLESARSTEETFIRIRAWTSTPPGPSIFHGLYSRTQQPPPFCKQMKLPTDCTPTSLSVSQPPLQADRNKLMELSVTAKELERPL